MTNQARLPARERNKFTIYEDEDSKAYDFVAARPPGPKTSTLGATGHLIKGCLGLGIMGIHRAYMKSGLWSSAVLIIIFAFFNATCMYSILYVRGHLDETPARSDVHDHNTRQQHKLQLVGRRLSKVSKSIGFYNELPKETKESDSETFKHKAKAMLMGKSYNHIKEARADKFDIENILANLKCILVKSAQRLYYRLHVTSLSYSDLAEAAVVTCCNEKLRKYKMCFRHYVDIIVAMDLFGACCCYQIFIGKTVKQFVERTSTASVKGMNGMPNLRVYIALLFIPIVLICMIRNLKFLIPFTLAANFFLVLSVGTTMYYGIHNARPLGDFPVFKDIFGFFEFSGSAVFSLGGIGVVLAIENNMKDPKRFPRVIVMAISIVAILLSLTGFFGYWAFGEECADAITLNFPTNQLVPAFIKALMAVMVGITYALNFWVPFNIVWYYIKNRYPEEKYWLWERVYRAIHVVSLTLLGIAVPTLGNFMGFIGALCQCHMIFIFPALISLLVDWEKPGLGKYKWRLWRTVFLCVLGSFFCICGSLVNGGRLVQFFMSTF